MIIRMVTILVCIFTIACGGDPQDLDQAQGKAEILREDCSTVVGCATYVTNRSLVVYDGPRTTWPAHKLTSLAAGTEVSVVKIEKTGLDHKDLTAPDTWALINFDGGLHIRGWVPIIYLNQDVCQDVKLYGDVPKSSTEWVWQYGKTIMKVSPDRPVKILEIEYLDSFMGTVVWLKVSVTVDGQNELGYLQNSDVTYKCLSDVARL